MQTQPRGRPSLTLVTYEEENDVRPEVADSDTKALVHEIRNRIDAILRIINAPASRYRIIRMLTGILDAGYEILSRETIQQFRGRMMSTLARLESTASRKPPDTDELEAALEEIRTLNASFGIK